MRLSLRSSLFRRLAATTALVAISATAIAAQQYLADVTGAWRVSLTMPDGAASTSIVTLKQAGDSISGTIESEQTGSRPLVGTVSGDTVRFGFSIDMQGNVLDIRVGGLLKDADTMEGEMALPGGMGSLPFSAKRQH